MDGKAGEVSELGCKLPRFRGPGTGLSREEQRVANHDGVDGEAARQSRDGAKVVAAIAVHFESQNGLSSEAELVGDRDADAFGAHVEAEIAGCGWQLRGS
jgi:hypothetical protein